MKTNYLPKAKIFSISDKNEGFITVTWPGLSKTVRSDDPQWNASVEAFKTENWQGLYLAMNPVETLNKLSYGNITYTDGSLYYKGQAVNHSLYERIKQNLKNSYSVTSLLAFLNNLYENPSFNSINQLYAFLEQRHIPITDDGCFLAYKAVRSDYYDKYSGTILNTVGKIVEIERSMVDDNSSAHCSHGLHVGGLDYINWYSKPGDKVVIVKVNPKDAVSVPTDHNFQKLRVCRYEVVDEYTGPLTGNVYKAAVNDVSDQSDTCDGDNWCGGSCTCYDTCDSDDTEVEISDFDGLNYDLSHQFVGSWITAVKYDTPSKTLIVEYIDKNEELNYYGHLDVPLKVVKNLIAAYRPGEYYNRYITNKYVKFDVMFSDGSGQDGADENLETHDFSQKSSWIDHAVYNTFTQELEVVLKRGDSYLHEYVIEAEWDDFKNSDSPGTFYNEVLKV